MVFGGPTGSSLLWKSIITSWPPAFNRFFNQGEIIGLVVHVVPDVDEQEPVDWLRQQRIVRLGQDSGHVEKPGVPDARVQVADHVGADVDRVDVALGPDVVRETQREIPRPGAHVGDHLARSQGQRLNDFVRFLIGVAGRIFECRDVSRRIVVQPTNLVLVSRRLGRDSAAQLPGQCHDEPERDEWSHGLSSSVHRNGLTL